MGLFRLLLALGVVTEHANIAWGAGSYTAVEAFFIMSGFYMALILSSGRYTTKDFYASRFFRLYPVYWAVLGIAICYYALAYSRGVETTLFTYAQQATIGLIGAIYLVFANVFMLGSDLTWFFPNAFGDQHSVHFLLIPPIWTLSLELVFYAFCPLLVGARSSTLWLIVAAAFAARAIAYGLGLDDNPWHARFIGFEIAFFVLGILAFRDGPRLRAPLAIALIAALFAFAVWFNEIAKAVPLPAVYNRHDYLHSLLFYALLLVTLRSLFDLTRESSVDQYLGEYSYPVYLLHYIFVIVLVHSSVAKSWGVNPGRLVVALTLIHAALLIHFVQVPIDRYRHRAFRRRNGHKMHEIGKVARIVFLDKRGFGEGHVASFASAPDFSALMGVRAQPFHRVPDERGSLSTIYRAGHEGTPRIQQWNVVQSRAGSLRGLHAHGAYDEYYVPLAGRMFFLLKDARASSPSFRAELSFWSDQVPDTAIEVPKGVAHGVYFESDAILAYGLSSPWTDEQEFGCRFDDKEIATPWPATRVLLSERDQLAGTFSSMVQAITRLLS
jgi:peptidoglycan/LPS O-acetylase OafA/YrhL/dTDP-4-dehydrorhamnose 3,5-epimerase-like enzyme